MTHTLEYTYLINQQRNLEYLVIISLRMARSWKATMLDRLPNEILDMVIRQCDGIYTLYSLVKADNQVHALFKRDPKNIIASAMDHSPLHLQFKKMLCTILSIRQCRDDIKSNQDHRRLLDRHINTWSTDLILDLDTLSLDGAMKLLEDAFDLCAHIY